MIRSLKSISTHSTPRRRNNQTWVSPSNQIVCINLPLGDHPSKNLHSIWVTTFPNKAEWFKWGNLLLDDQWCEKALAWETWSIQVPTYSICNVWVRTMNLQHLDERWKLLCFIICECSSEPEIPIDITVRVPKDCHCSVLKGGKVEKSGKDLLQGCLTTPLVIQKLNICTKTQLPRAIIQKPWNLLRDIFPRVSKRATCNHLCIYSIGMLGGLTFYHPCPKRLFFQSITSQPFA